MMKSKNNRDLEENEVYKLIKKEKYRKAVGYSNKTLKIEDFGAEEIQFSPVSKSEISKVLVLNPKAEEIWNNKCIALKKCPQTIKYHITLEINLKDVKTSKSSWRVL